MTPDEIRAIVREEVDEALRPVREAIARLGDIHSAAEQEIVEHDAGVRAARRALANRLAAARGQPTVDGTPQEARTDVEPESQPERPAETPGAQKRTTGPRRPVLRPRVCPRCENDMVRVDGELRCPRGSCR